MTRDEALREVGVAPGATADEVRRAYLRLVRTRKPEADPEGFRRLREAYELLQSGGGDEEEVPDREPEAADDAADDADTAAGDPRQAWIEALIAGLNADPDAAARIERLRRAIGEQPFAPDPRWWLARELFAAERPDESAAVLREADAAGMPGFFQELAHSFPHLLTPAELERLAAGGDPGALAILAEALLERGDTAAAADAMQQAMDAADAQSGVLSPASPPPGRVVHLLLHLQRHGALASSRSVFEQFRQRLRDSGQETRLMSDQMSAVWAIVCDLHQLSPAFHLGAREAIAQATLDGDPGKAAPELERIARESLAQTLRYAEMLQPRLILGPLFYDLFRNARPRSQPPPPPAQTPRTGSRMDPRAIAAFVVLFAVLAVIGAFAPEDRPPAQPPAPDLPAGTRRLSGPNGDPGTNGLSPAVLVLSACPPGREPAGTKEACRRARNVIQALMKPDCGTALYELDHLRTDPGFQGERLRDVENRLTTAIRTQCGARLRLESP